ncbi:MAG: DNA methyltransferase [Candidatus Woesearchaeota archaeon]
MHLILLSQENIALSEIEASSLLELKAFTRQKHIIFSNIDKKNLNKISRLACTKKVLELLFICNVKDLGDALLNFDFKKYYAESFCLRIHDDKHRFNESEYAKYIWRSLESKKIIPKVHLDNPKTLIEILIISNKAFVCRQLLNNKEHFGLRKAHLMPELHPTAMHPRMAKALINILNPKKGEKIIDPFCGAGGIIREASLMNIKSEGYDIDEIQIRRAKINLGNIKNFKLKKCDATKIKNLKNIVTDLPYGKSSKKTTEINKLYSSFVKNIIGRAVIVFPNFSDYKKILQENLNKKLVVKKIINHYVHKSLTRKIVVIDEKDLKTK